MPAGKSYKAPSGLNTSDLQTQGGGGICLPVVIIGVALLIVIALAVILGG